MLARSQRDDTDTVLVCDVVAGAPMGLISLSNLVSGAFRSATLGYWIGERHAGRGLMGEALDLYLRRAFETLGLHRVEANVRPENTPSRALVRGRGFFLEGYSPRYLEIDGRWCDHERWALLAEEWRGTWRRADSSPGSTTARRPDGG